MSDLIYLPPISDTVNASCCTFSAINGTLHNTTASSQYFFLLQLVIVKVIKSLLLPLVTPILLTVICCHFWEIYNDCLRDPDSDLPLPPGGYGFPLVGESIGFLLQGRKFFDKRKRQFGTIFKTHMFGKPTIRVIGIQSAKKILGSENELVTSQWPKSTKLLLGDGSLTAATGHLHSIRKKAILKAFTSSALGGYATMIQKLTKDHIDYWCSKEKILGYKEFKGLTFDISCQVLLGIKMERNERNSLMEHFDTFLSNLFSIPAKIPGLGLYKGLKARSALLDKIGSCIRKKKPRGSNVDFQDALSLLMNISGSGEMSVTELQDIGLELLFAGHETTASATVTLILQLSKHPHVVTKIQDELRTLGISNQDLTYETLNKMKYLTNVVKEAIRITPPVGGGYRKVLQTFEIEGYQIPKGWTVAYSIRDTHEMGNDLILDPDSFNPDRWTALQKRDHEHFIAFGGGKKGCAGKQLALLMLKIFTAEMVRTCKWVVPNSNPNIEIIPVPHPTDNLPMKIFR